jgi:lipopolysaccharide/colanic/teichoic acid biosynthesis glycosyltransferase
MNLLTNPPPSIPLCRLIWRQNKLWVLPEETSKPHLALPALAQPEWFRACLKRSKAKAVVIDPSLGSEVIRFWAEACEQVKKPLFLRLPAMVSLPEKKKVWAWRTKCVFERIVGFGLLLLFCPLLLVFTTLLRLQDGGAAVTYEFCVGKRGRIFSMAQFRRASITTGQVTRLGGFLEVSRLDRLPRLANLVKGEMTLIGTKPWTIQDLVNIPPEYRPCLKAMPGLVGTRPLGLTIRKVDIPYIVQGEWSYLKNWSLWRDGITAATAVVGLIGGQPEPPFE